EAAVGGGHDRCAIHAARTRRDRLHLGQIEGLAEICPLFFHFPFHLQLHYVTRSHVNGVPLARSRDTRRPRTSPRNLGGRPWPGRIERTLCSLNSSPAFMARTTKSDRREFRLASSWLLSPYWIVPTALSAVRTPS